MAEATIPDAGAQTKEADPRPAPLIDIRKRLDVFRKAGGEQFDAVGFSHVARLLARGASLSGPGQTLLANRADAYLSDLERTFASCREHAARDVERLERVYSSGRFIARAAYESGDLARVRRVARRHPQASARLRDEVTRRWEEALDAEIEKRGLSSPGTLNAPTEEEVATADVSPSEAPSRTGIAPATGLDMAIALYRNTAARADVQRVLTRAIAALPDEAGRYHAATVATQTLQSLQDAQPYLHALMAQLSTLTLLAETDPAAHTPSEPPPRERKRRPRRR